MEDSVLFPKWLSKDYLQNFVENHINKNALLEGFEVMAGSNVGDNYICEVYRIKLLLSENGQTSDLFVIGKHNGSSVINQSIAKIGYDVHGTETAFLFSALHLLEKYSSDCKLGPIGYFSDDNHKMIFMEDLKPLGFEMVPRNIFLDIDHCLKTIQALAIFHAASYLEIQKNPELAQRFAKNLWQKELNDEGRTFVNSVLEGIEKKMDTWEFTPKHKKLIQKYRERIFTEGYQICQYDPTYFNVLAHRDCWKNNMMYKYKNGKVAEICLLDFQLVNYNCFALDIQYFLSSSALKEIRYEKEDEILTYYYQEFNKIAPNVPELSLNRVKKEFKDKDFFGLITTIMLRGLVISEIGINFDELQNGKSDGGMGDRSEFGDELKHALDFYENIV